MLLKMSLLVAAGGAIGALSRFWAGRWIVGSFGVAPIWGTLSVNVVGCFMAGLFLAWSSLRSDALAFDAHSFVLVGFLGGLTTFSAFSLEALTLWMRGDERLAIFYVLLSFSLSLIAVAMGVILPRKLILL